MIFLRDRRLLSPYFEELQYSCLHLISYNICAVFCSCTIYPPSFLTQKQDAAIVELLSLQMQQVVTRAPCGLSKYLYHALHAFETSAPEL